jgi:hypothetical protein
MNVSITDIMVDDDITKFTIKKQTKRGERIKANTHRHPACVIQTDSEAVNQCKIEINTGDLTTSFN